MVYIHKRQIKVCQSFLIAYIIHGMSEHCMDFGIEYMHVLTKDWIVIVFMNIDTNCSFT